MVDRLCFAAWLIILLLALAVRISPIVAARPYIAYIDEGNFLHPVVRVLREGGWDPREYDYPQFPRTVVAAAVRAYSPIYKAIHGYSIRRRYSGEPGIYDLLEPFDVLFIARLISLLASVGVIVLTGMLARQLAGWRAAAAAVLLAAVTP